MHVRLGDSSDHCDRTLAAALSSRRVGRLCFPSNKCKQDVSQPAGWRGCWPSYSLRIIAAPVARSFGRAGLYVFPIRRTLNLQFRDTRKKQRLWLGPHPALSTHPSTGGCSHKPLPSAGLPRPALVFFLGPNSISLGSGCQILYLIYRAGPIKAVGVGGHIHHGVWMHNGLTKIRQTARSPVVSKGQLLLHPNTPERAVSVSR